MSLGDRKMKDILRGLFLCFVLLVSGCSQVPASLSVTQPADIPAYEGEASINLGLPDFTDEEAITTAYKQFSDLDSLGRTQSAMAVLGPELLPQEGRKDISSVHPSGWVQADYDFVDQGKLYNRCHLIAFSLSGENANPANLMTGTRYMNTQGMLPYESQVLDYIRDTGNHVLYRVSPVYTGDNLLADGVIMEAYSVEDHGKGLSFKVYCYNVQPGVEIDYATGESRAADVASDAEGGQDYVVNTNTGKFHTPYCSQVERISEKNRLYVRATAEELIESGYSPAKECN